MKKIFLLLSFVLFGTLTILAQNTVCIFSGIQDYVMQQKIQNHFDLYAGVIGGHPKDSLEFIISELPPPRYVEGKKMPNITAAFTYADRKTIEFFRKNIDSDRLLETVASHEFGHTLVDPKQRVVVLRNGEKIRCIGIQCNENKNHERRFEESIVSYIAEWILRISHDTEPGEIISPKSLDYLDMVEFWFGLEGYTLNGDAKTISESIYFPAFLDALKGSPEELFALLDIKSTFELELYQYALVILNPPMDASEMATSIGNKMRLNILYSERLQKHGKDALVSGTRVP